MAQADSKGQSTPFIEFMLESIQEALTDFSDNEQVAEQVNEQVKNLILYLNDQVLSGREIMHGLELKHRPTFLYDYLQPALQKGFIEMTQPESPKSPTQKYRITGKGRVALTNI